MDVAAPKTSAGLNDWTNESTNDAEDYCVEKWTIATTTGALATETTYAERCVKMAIKGERLFKTAETGALGAGPMTELNTADIDLEYRKYSVTTGWLIPETVTAATVEPGLIFFDPVEVDFAIFQAESVKYEGAVNGLAIAGTAGLVAAVLAMSF